MGHGAAPPSNAVPRLRLDAAKVSTTLQALATPWRLLILARLREGAPARDRAGRRGGHGAVRLLPSTAPAAQPRSRHRDPQGPLDRLRPVRQPRRRGSRAYACRLPATEERRAHQGSRHGEAGHGGFDDHALGMGAWRSVALGIAPYGLEHIRARPHADRLGQWSRLYADENQRPVSRSSGAGARSRHDAHLALARPSRNVSTGRSRRGAANGSAAGLAATSRGPPPCSRGLSPEVANHA